MASQEGFTHVTQDGFASKKEPGALQFWPAKPSCGAEGEAYLRSHPAKPSGEAIFGEAFANFWYKSRPDRPPLRRPCPENSFSSATDKAPGISKIFSPVGSMSI